MPKKIVTSGKTAVKLTLSGQVNRVSMFADDGTGSSFFHCDNENSSTRWRLVGKARINDEWTVGTKIEQDIQTNNCAKVDISGDEIGGDATAFDNRHQVFYIDSKNIGRVWLGKTDAFSNNIVQIDLSGTAVVQYSGMNDIGGGFVFREDDGTFGTDAKVSDVYSQFDGLSRVHQIQYNTPTVGGFKLGITHVQEDKWDVGGRYAAKFKEAGLKVSAGIAYWEFGSDAKETGFESGVGGSISFLHNSGFNLTFAAATQDRLAATPDDPVSFYIKPGFQFQANKLGKTALTVHYGRAEDKKVQNDEYENWGVELVQKVDKAAMELFAFWELNTLDRDGKDFDDINIGGIGARVKF